MRVTGFDGAQQHAARKALGPKPVRAVHPSPPHPSKGHPLLNVGNSPRMSAEQPGLVKTKNQPLVPVLGYSRRQIRRIQTPKRQLARQIARQHGLPMVAPVNTQTAETHLHQIKRGLVKRSNEYAAMVDPLSHENLAFDANFAKNLVPQSLIDVAHGHAPSGRHLGEDALFFTPWSRGLRASAEAIRAAHVADEGVRLGEAARAAKGSYKAGRGVAGGLAGASKKLLPSERALARSPARSALFEHLNATLEPKQAQAEKNLFDRSLKSMVRNGKARNVEEAAGRLIHVRSHIHQNELPGELKGLYQHEAIPHPDLPEKVDAKAIAKEIRATHRDQLPPELRKPGALERAINRTHEHLKLGAGYRDWYKRYAGVMAKTAEASSLGHVSPRQVAQLMAVYSQRAMPTENFRRAITSALQHGDFQIFGGQAEKAKKIVQDPTWFEREYLPSQSGPKISNYYANALEHLDPEHFKQLWGDRPAPVTVDTHMNRMLTGTDRVQDKHYEGLAQIFRVMGRHLGLPAHEVQAGSWVSKKAANEAENIAKKLTAKGVEFAQRPASEYLHSSGDAYERAYEKYHGTLFQKELSQRGMTQRVLDHHAGQDLEGLPSKIKVAGKQVEWHSYGPAQDIASSYMEKAGLPYHPPATYAKVDPERAKRIAEWYDQAIHAPLDPEVAQAYDAMARETLAQYHEIVGRGYKFEFYPKGVDPYPHGPRQAILDLIQNKHMYVFPTEGGFGTEHVIAEHPLLADSGVVWNGQRVTHNDIFRAVHDFFGHAKEGVGFRADGEENAWRSHSAMYSPEARKAMTAETRGQNSWVNFGPHGEANRTASQMDTVYADQKAVVAPDWVVHDGAGDISPSEQKTRELLAERAQLHKGLPAKGTGDRVSQIDDQLDQLIGPGSGRLRQDFTEPPKSAGEVAMNAAQRSGVTFKGAFEPVHNGESSIIHLTEHADVTTLPHEMGHFLRRFGLTPQHEAAIADWAGAKNGVWDTAAEEKFATGLESFIRSGAAPNTLKAEFEQLAPAFRAAYPEAGSLPTLTPEVADVYRQLLGHRDGLASSAYFLLRNKAVGRSLLVAGRRGQDRNDQEVQSYLDQVRQQAKDEGFGVKGGSDKLVDVKPGEAPAEQGGPLGALVRAGLKDPSGLKAAGAYEKVGAQLEGAPRTIGEMDKQQEEARGIARSKKAGGLHGAQQDALTSDHPYQAFMAAGAARKGMLPKSEFKGFDQLEPHLDNLTMFVGNHPKLKPFERQNIMEAITRGIVENRMPARYERRLIAKAFGREAASGWAKAVRRGEVTLADVLNIPRAAMSSMDLSAGMRQGLAAMFYKPDIFFSDWTKQLHLFVSEGKYGEIQKMIEDHPDFALADKAKISFTDIHAADINQMEEAYGSQLAEHIPIVGRFIRASDRAYTGFLNALRMHLFSYMVNDAASKGWNLDQNALESMGAVVNAMTGRGNLPHALAEHRQFLNAMFFSPGLAFSRLNMLGFGGGHGWQNLVPGGWYLSLHPYARREALSGLMRLTAGLSTILFFAHAAGASVSLDPRNADFGKIRVGDTRFDVAGGFQQWVRLISEMATGQIVSSTTGRVEKLSGGGFAGQTRLDAALQFLENKEAPVPAMATDLLRGTGFGHQPITAQSELASHLVPLVWQDMYGIAFSGPPWNAHVNHAPGAGLKMALAASIPDLLGVGVQNYSAPGPKTQLNQDKLAKESQQAGLGKVPAQVQEDVQWKSRLDAATYAGMSPYDRAAAALKLYDERYHKDYEKTLLPHIHTDGQAQALYQEIRPSLFPSLEKWQSAVNKELRAKAAEKPITQTQQQPKATSAPAMPTVNTDLASYHVSIPDTGAHQGVDAATHTIVSGGGHTAMIASAARAHGLDPRAVLAVASQEGLSGGIGDGGTSFGPFQLHEGGALPPEVAARGAQYAQKWAWSPEGINYALGRMAGVAKGLHGQEAVSAIVRGFERPANPGGEIAGAMGAYGGPMSSGPIQMGGGFGGGMGPGPGAGTSRLTSAADSALEMLASGTYSPMRMLSVLSSEPLQNTMDMPGFGHVRFQIPKFTGPVGRAARGAIALAQAFLGTPYVWGGESPRGFDCSGLLQYIYAKQGVNIPRTSQQQWNAGQPVGKSQLRPGDAVFFEMGKGGPGHVGIYIGHGKFIEAPHTGATVRISNLAGYPGYVGARRYARARGRRAA